MNMRFCGREFTSEEVDWLRSRIDTGLNRYNLSKQFCERSGWFKPDGGLKDMSCRVALLKMNRTGLLTLPPPQKRDKKFNNKTPKRTLFGEPQPAINLKAGQIDLKLEQTNPRTSALWNELIDRYHYLGYTPLAGAQLRYFVKSGDAVLALFGFSAAAWKTAPRDHYIGWDIEQRKKNLHLIVNNSRFLVLPWVHCRNLCSRILSLAGRILPLDWESRYNYRPVLLETFVEKQRFTGACYKATNWLHVGDTQGRGKLDIHNERKLPVKSIWLYPLARNFRRQLYGGKS